MNCTSARDLLSPRLDGVVPVDEARDVDAHVAACEACSMAWRQLGELRALLQAFEEEESLVLAPGVLARRVHAAAKRPPSLRWLLNAVVAVALLGAITPLVIARVLPRPVPAVAPLPVTEGAVLTLTLGTPDGALLDRISAFFREWPGSVEEVRGKRNESLELRCRGVRSAALTEFQKRIPGFLNDLKIQNGSWQWRNER